ncbi:MAG: citrate/2-methylcitrate synthase, partial [Nitrososphaerales archaeon]
MSTKNIGLRNVEVADTKICSIDGENGKLTYRGFDIFDLAKNSTFEEASYLLLFGDLPTEPQLHDFKKLLHSSRDIPVQVIRAMKERPKSASPMDVLQSSVSMLADFDESINDDSRNANVNRAIGLIAKFPTIVAAWNSIRNGTSLVQP